MRICSPNSFKETCTEYLARRLSEGWKVRDFEYPFIWIVSPDGGVVRDIDLRNDILTIRPTGAGDSTQNSKSGADTNWECCDDTGEGDGNSTYVQAPTNAVWTLDLYALANHTIEAGAITNVRVLARCKRIDSVLTGGQYRTAMKIGGTTDYGTAGNATSYTLVYKDYAVNPDDSAAWEWTDIDNLQAGCSLYLDQPAKDYSFGRCTQDYVEVTFTPAGGETYTRTYTADALFKKLGIAKTLDADALLKKLGILETIDADVLVQKLGITRTFLAKVIFGAANIQEVTADVLLKALGLTQTLDVDALLQQQDITETVDADAILKLIATRSIDADAILKAIKTATFTVDVRLGEAGAVAFTASVYFKRLAFHVILDGQYTQGSPGVNRVYIIGKDAEGNPVYGSSLNQDEIDLVGERLDFNQELSIPTDAKAADVAAAIVAKARLTGSRGYITIPPNCGQELWDVIQVTDKPTAQSQQKYRVIAVSFDYEPHRHRYQHKLILGAP